jgi:hypothetical protein
MTVPPGASSQPPLPAACASRCKQEGAGSAVRVRQEEPLRPNFGVLLEGVKFVFCTITFAYVRPTCRLSRRNLALILDLEEMPELFFVHTSVEYICEYT